MRKQLEAEGATFFDYDDVYSPQVSPETFASLIEHTGALTKKYGPSYFSGSEYPRVGEGRYTVSYVQQLIGDRPVDTVFFDRRLTDQDRDALEAFPEAQVGAVPEAK
jgi:hypothetical protein